MFCSNCGSPVGDQEKFCKVCGTPVNVQTAPVVYQQPVQAAAVTAAPALAKEKAGPRRTCFVVGLVTCIMLIVLNVPAFAIGGMMLLVGPFAMMLGASNSEDLFGMGLLVCLGAALLVALAVISIVFNGISSKVTAKRPESKCKRFRMAAAIMVLVDALITIAPIIGLNNMMSDAEFFYGLYGLVMIMAIVFFVLAIITNSKEKKLASA